MRGGCTAARLLGKLLCLMVDNPDEKTPVQFIAQQYGIDCRVLAVRPDCPESEKGLENVKELSRMEPPVPAPNEHWLWLSPTECKIVKAASTVEWKPLKKLVADAGVPYDRDVEGIVRNMVERKILESANGKGYRLLNPPQAPQQPPSQVS